jgi:hypothetical protein
MIFRKAHHPVRLLRVLAHSVLLIFIFNVAISCSERYNHTVQQMPHAPIQAKPDSIPDYKDSTITIAAGKHYGRGRLHTFFYGKHYRDAWTTPVQIPVLDIGTAKGGLTPIQIGGSRQTISLRVEDTIGTEYVIRSIDKEPASSLSAKMQKSYIAHIARDATSATHPYAALTLPPMAEAIGIYHTRPELVFVPHDPRLGKYKDIIGGTVALLERRPDGDQTDNPFMGNAKKVKSTRAALSERLTENDSKFNARFYLRARLFDMLLGDWSRHEDNWRWAEFKTGKNAYTYKGIPRDRDNVFYMLVDAPIPWVFMRTNFKPHFQTFRKKVRNIEKLNRSGRNLDELILAELQLKDWLEIADSVQMALTDQVIDDAFKRMPENIYQLTAPPIIEKLKLRRDQLSQVATDYYQALSKDAQLVGTDKHELFQVEVLSTDEVRVRIYKTDKDGSKEELLTERTYYSNETSQISLYGLDGSDKFIVKGNAKPAIKIHLWGGAGEDTYVIEDKKSQIGKNIRITDSEYGNTFDIGKYADLAIDNNMRAKDFDATGWLLRYYLD